MKKDETIYYPQDELRTSLLPVTISCQYNACKFCSMYKGQDYRQVPMSEIENILINMDKYEERIFLTGADPLSIGFEKMEALLDTINHHLPYCACVASYASIRSLSNYSLGQLSILHNKGLRLLYIGFESGSDHILKMMNKGHRVENAISQGQKLNEANLLFNSIVMYGIGGRGRAEENALATSRMLNQFQSKTIITMNLMVFNGTELASMVRRGEFREATARERLLELKILLQELEPAKPTIFDSSHPTNIIKIKGVIPGERKRLQRELDLYA